MKIGRCACGASWHQRGNQSGHATCCHLTFSSEAAFGRHRRVTTCVHPSTVGLIPRVDKLGTEQWGQPGSRPRVG